MTIDYPFTEQELQTAADEWGCNCGPSALAFALRVPLSDIQGKIPGFDAKRYTSPSMMKSALNAMGVQIKEYPAPRLVAGMFHPKVLSLVRIQWTGPWTAPGANPKWAYRETHWIVAWKDEKSLDNRCMVFDCNGGIREFPSWTNEIVPALLASNKRADGGWFPTHVWRVASPDEQEAWLAKSKEVP